MSHLTSGTLARALCAGTLVVASLGGARAADVTMDLGWATPLDSDNGIIATKFEELVERYSDGSIDVKLRCCGQIATEDDAFKALQLGTVDAYLISQNNVSPHWPLMDVLVLPYIFQSTEHLLKVADGEIGQSIKDRIKADTGVTLLTFGGPSYRDFFNSRRPIESMADMDGLKVRVPKNEVMLDTFEAFGAEPVPLAWSETPTALQTGTIDGADNGTNVIQEMKFFEFAPYLTVLDHFSGFTPLLASARFMDRLDDAQREAVQRAADEAGAYQSEILASATDDIRAWLVEEGGMQMTEPDRTEFIAAAQAVQEEIATERGEDFAALVETIRRAAE